MRFLLMLVFTTVAAVAERPPDMAVTSEDRSRVVEAVADRIERYYVDAVKGKEIASALRDALKSGRLTDATSAHKLVPAMNKILQSLGDRHLRFGYSYEPATERDDALETPDDRAARVRGAERDAFGIHGIQRLEGNVGLLTWTKFHGPDVAGDAVATAMRFLQSMDAMIIDLRNSDGGSPDMVMLLLTYFMPEGEPVLVTSVENRYKGFTQQFWTLPFVPGRRYVGKDVYILTSKRTWSAGEGFTERMRRLRNATVVGETTRGGAYMSRWMTVHPHFAVSVSVARHVAAPGHIGWEGVGVTPDVVVPEAEALRAAHLLALRKLREHATEQDKDFFDSAIAHIKQPM